MDTCSDVARRETREVEEIIADVNRDVPDQSIAIQAN